MRLSTLIILIIITPYLLVGQIPGLQPLIDLYNSAYSQLTQLLNLDNMLQTLKKLFGK